jgi:hypothetical protein
MTPAPGGSREGQPSVVVVRRTSNIQRSTSNVEVMLGPLDVERWTLNVGSSFLLLFTFSFREKKQALGCALRLNDLSEHFT